MFKEKLKMFFKRITAVFLIVCLCSGFLPLDVGFTSQVWAENNQNQVIKNPEKVDMEGTLLSYRKSIVQNEKDKFTITLDVITSERIDLIPSNGGTVVLVMDNSGSMKDSYSNAKEAVKAFADKFLASNNSQNKLGLVTYEGGYLPAGQDAYDEIGNGYTAKQGSLTNNLEYFMEKAEAVPAPKDKDTNVQSGIKLARDILEKDTSDNSKIIVVLSDGASHYSSMPLEAKGLGTNTIIPYVGFDSIKKEDIVYNLNFRFTTFNYNSLATESTKFDDNSHSIMHPITVPIAAAISESILAKEDGIEVFSLFFKNKISDFEYDQGVFTMKNVASSEKRYFQIDNADELISSFEDIEQYVSEFVSPWSITDPMGDFITFDGFKGENPPGVSFDNDSKTLTWNMREEGVEPEVKDGSYHYKLSYDITLNSSDENFEFGKSYPTNGTTKLLYQHSENNILKEKEVDFVVPEVKGEEKSYTLKFESNGGTPIDPITSVEGSKVTLGQIPKKEEHSFEGWYEDKELTKPVNEVVLDRDKIVYAKWERIIKDDKFYTLNFESNGGTPVDSVTKVEGSNVILNQNTSKAGYTFRVGIKRKAL